VKLAACLIKQEKIIRLQQRENWDKERKEKNGKFQV
jgi:hypothetical protein